MPRPTRRARAEPPRDRTEEPPSQYAMDPADIIMGIVLFIALPAITYILLAAVGKPVSGRQTRDVTEVMRENEAIKNRKPPPMTKEEFRIRIAYVDKLLDTNATQYEKRFRRADQPKDKYPWWKRAMDVLSHCEDVLKELSNSIARSPELKGSAFTQDITVRGSRIAQEIFDLNKDRPFLDH